MKDFEELKSIWHGQSVIPKMSYDDILIQVKKSKRYFANKLLFQVIALITAIGIMIYILLKAPFILGTSQLALLIFITCCIYYLFIQVRDYRDISLSERLLDEPEEYINYLKTYKNKRYILNTSTYRVYTIFIGIGMGLYFIEVFLFTSIWITVLTVTFTIAWFLLCYYVFMKIYIRKEETRLNEMIDNLERVQKQFNTDDL